MREVFRAMSSFETAFEKVYRITLNEAMILCILKDATERMTATNLSKSTDLSPSHTSKMLRILEEKRIDCQGTRQRGPPANVLSPVFNRQTTG